MAAMAAGRGSVALIFLTPKSEQFGQLGRLGGSSLLLREGLFFGLHKIQEYIPLIPIRLLKCALTPPHSRSGSTRSGEAA
jgi:hypothetical protein